MRKIVSLRCESRITISIILIKPNSESNGPLRVWIDLGYKLGLCMTRSMGDNDAKPFGITADPSLLFNLVLTKFEKNDNDCFVVIASDGLWEFNDS